MDYSETYLRVLGIVGDIAVDRSRCAYCGKIGVTRRCSKCKVYYCNRECQLADWYERDHKIVCKYNTKYLQDSCELVNWPEDELNLANIYARQFVDRAFSNSSMCSVIKDLPKIKFGFLELKDGNLVSKNFIPRWNVISYMPVDFDSADAEFFGIQCDDCTAWHKFTQHINERTYEYLCRKDRESCQSRSHFRAHFGGSKYREKLNTLNSGLPNSGLPNSGLPNGGLPNSGLQKTLDAVTSSACDANAMLYTASRVNAIQPSMLFTLRDINPGEKIEIAMSPPDELKDAICQSRNTAMQNNYSKYLKIISGTLKFVTSKVNKLPKISKKEHELLYCEMIDPHVSEFETTQTSHA